MVEIGIKGDGPNDTLVATIGTDGGGRVGQYGQSQYVPRPRGGVILRGSQRGGLKGAAANKGACVLDIPGDRETGGQKSGAPEGTSSKHKGG